MHRIPEQSEFLHKAKPLKKSFYRCHSAERIMDKDLEKIIKITRPFTFLLPNVACFVTGSVKGTLDAIGIQADLPLPDFWAANILGAAIFKTASTKQEESYALNTIKGTLLGAITAPIE